MTANELTDVRGENQGKECIEYKRKMQRRESNFETNLSVVLSYMKCAYIKIPDPIYTQSRVKAMREGRDQKSRKRPFDGMIVTNADETHTGGIYAVEAKYNNNTLEQHQVNYLTMVNKVNGMGYVIRARTTKDMDIYTVEWPEKNVLFKTTSLAELATWFKELSRLKK